MYVYYFPLKLVLQLTNQNKGPPTSEALMYGIFQLQKKMRHTRITRMWYRR
jgi:NADH dehydrogenase (ubiquinone) Fe-S protein 7